MKYSESLKKTEDFRCVYDNGGSAANRLLVLYAKKNDLGTNRLGISISKKVGNSVVRHRIRRLIKEAWRLNEEYFNTGYDCVFIARAASKDSTYFEIESAICRLMNKQGIMEKV